MGDFLGRAVRHFAAAVQHGLFYGIAGCVQHEEID